ncbi:MAG: hypothetical protein AAF799_07095 [Myxococcota bacterium]
MKYVSLKRLCVVAVLFGLGACATEEPGGIEASVSRAELDVDPAMPEARAELDVTVEVLTRGQPEDVTLEAVVIHELPLADDSDSITFVPQLVNPQGDDPIVRLVAGEEIVLRVLNAGTTNEELSPWCNRPVQLAVTLATASGAEAEATQDISVRCP